MSMRYHEVSWPLFTNQMIYIYIYTHIYTYIYIYYNFEVARDYEPSILDRPDRPVGFAAELRFGSGLTQFS